MNRRELIKGLLTGTAAAIVLPGDEVVRRFWRGWTPTAAAQESGWVWPFSAGESYVPSHRVEMTYQANNGPIQTVMLGPNDPWTAEEDTLILEFKEVHPSMVWADQFNPWWDAKPMRSVEDIGHILPSDPDYDLALVEARRREVQETIHYRFPTIFVIDRDTLH